MEVKRLSDTELSKKYIEQKSELITCTTEGDDILAEGIAVDLFEIECEIVRRWLYEQRVYEHDTQFSNN